MTPRLWKLASLPLAVDLDRRPMPMWVSSSSFWIELFRSIMVAAPPSSYLVLNANYMFDPSSYFMSRWLKVVLSEFSSLTIDSPLLMSYFIIADSILKILLFPFFRVVVAGPPSVFFVLYRSKVSCLLIMNLSFAVVRFFMSGLMTEKESKYSFKLGLYLPFLVDLNNALPTLANYILLLEFEVVFCAYTFSFFRDRSWFLKLVLFSKWGWIVA